jgi:hypothetical protein
MSLKKPENMSPELASIWESYTNTNKEIDKQHTKQMAKIIGGGLLSIGSAFMPGTAGLKITGALGKAITPMVGKKIGTEIASGLVSGGLSGAVEGFGRGLIENKNPLKTMAQDSLLVATTGGLGGYGLGKINQFIDGKNVVKLENEDFGKYLKAVNDYYKNYERGLNTHNKHIGKIELVSDGMKETNKQKPSKSKGVVGLSKSLSEADYIGTELPEHTHKYQIDKFFRLRNGKDDFLVSNNPKNKKKYFHKITDPNLAEP